MGNTAQSPLGLDNAIDQIHEAIISMNHALVFISTREKMHPTGIELFKTAIDGLEYALVTVKDLQATNGSGS